MKTVSPELRKAAELIDHSEIFELSREANPSKYRNLEYELIENLYKYVQLSSSSQYQDMGLEIVETAADCLRSYDKDRGRFTHYFFASLKRRSHREQAIRNASETRGGIAISREDQKRITDIQQIAGMLGREIGDNVVIEAATQYLIISTARVGQLIRLNDQLAFVHDQGTEDAGEIFNLISDAFALEDDVLEKMSLAGMLDAIESCFLQCRRSQQEVLSPLLTCRLLEGCPPNMIQMAMSKSFFDLALYQDSKGTGHIPTARDISSALNKDEASTSRTFSTFRKKLKNYFSELQIRGVCHE